MQEVLILVDVFKKNDDNDAFNSFKSEKYKQVNKHRNIAEVVGIYMASFKWQKFGEKENTAYFPN